MSPFQSLREYELLVYSLHEQFSEIVRSTLVVAQRGRLFAELTGEVGFTGGYRLVVYERLTWDTGTSEGVWGERMLHAEWMARGAGTSGVK